MNNSKYKILVVDDVINNQKIVVSTLEKSGYVTYTADNGLEALNKVKEISFDLILLDIMMPVMSGIGVCKYLKVDSKTANIPVIFLTASTDKKTLEKAYSVGGVDYITKPFVKEELLARVRTHLKISEYERHLEDEVEAKTKAISDTQIKLMYALGGIAEGHSKETYAHVKRVTEFAYQLAKLYGMDEKESILLKNAASLHDVGKLGIKDSILHKNGKLTSQEYKIMKGHASIGVEMLKHSQLPLLKAATIVAGGHHEKYDGTGYPKGLKGENIHIYARIVAIADVFDALSFKRAYKDSWSTEDVIDYIISMSGKHFDPNLVKIFVDNINSFLVIYNKEVEKSEFSKKLLPKKKNKIIEWLFQEL